MNNACAIIKNHGSNLNVIKYVDYSVCGCCLMTQRFVEATASLKTQLKNKMSEVLCKDRFSVDFIHIIFLSRSNNGTWSHAVVPSCQFVFPFR